MNLVAQKTAPSCTLVIFGAAGDLTKRLLMPALYNLASEGLLAEGFSVVGVDRAALDRDGWARGLTATMNSFTEDPTAEFYTPQLDAASWGFVESRLDYLQGDFTDAALFGHLKERLGGGNVIFYLAVASRFVGDLVDRLGTAGLLDQSAGGFRRLVVEKPFGSDLPSAQALNRRILRQAQEEQVFRIDHFLGKETVQSIMAVRFANGMFEPTWRREYIDHVQITAAETVGVEERGAFYETTGALRDMVPNHLFTLLCMVAMDPPNSFAAEDVRTEKFRLLQAIRPVPPEDAVRGQYTAGEEVGHPVPAYRDEHGVDPASATETYVAMKLRIENWRWAGVPFYLRTGKRLTGRRTEISVHFRPAPYRLFRDTPADHTTPNVVRLLIDPERGFETQFDAKLPGPSMRLGRVCTRMRYDDFFEQKPSVGYETLLYDCMRGDATLFQRADAIEAAWAAVQPVLDDWGGRTDAGATYAAGSEGPAAADALLARDGRSWLPLHEERSAPKTAETAGALTSSVTQKVGRPREG
ncbi:glucose-6-phosphate dehydrogenase [Roseomonas elaeocarpi]|uniref:Glucose-6-phosphate 1-dehydrogenase n=1 Tax=Roseomonas elaeocarpi TaxID=907779 RepID=A0ABV6JVF9_9PROT